MRTISRNEYGDPAVFNDGKLCCSGPVPFGDKGFCENCQQAMACHRPEPAAPMPVANWDWTALSADPSGNLAWKAQREAVANGSYGEDSPVAVAYGGGHHEPPPSRQVHSGRPSYPTAREFLQLSGNVDYAQGGSRREPVTNDLYDFFGGGRTPQLTPEQKRDVLPVQNYEYADWSRERDDERPRG